ncbi:hypothetical protein A3L04_06715 [Thermococcus chitonophagus]|uniref:UPF0127 protein A3L04_06715 n=1 Tax=Thermococcus chitonophagus TaxID=54262 RepID=A0A160VTK0_9EURY|nr:DUF192 domain-containing protein [Thermococcus chitonophagus]ASJ16788.1 hypothetical protein A3L04_06715 [Thermococcus chitonophagus]CUX78260.1 hypothetical protein CHITON_1481 [Thermococcus chitonophagus]
MLINETKELVWGGEVKFADTFIKRFLGLMFRKPRYALIFVLPTETRINASIHGFFMREAIDVIFLDSKRKVVDFTILRPWRLYTPKRPAKYIIEGPKGMLQTLRVEVGDVIKW